MFSWRFVANGDGGGAEDGEWKGGESSSGAAGQGEVAVLSPALIGTRTSLSSHQRGETQLVS